MTNQHPVTPPPELVDQWVDMLGHRSDHEVFAAAAQWGADQELEACCEWFVLDWTDIETADKLRAARRPKPPSLKEQALEAFDRINDPEGTIDWDTIRRALELLPDD